MSNQPAFLWKSPALPARFRSGFSLHSHTLHSRESLDFIPRLARHVPLLTRELNAAAREFERAHAQPLNFDKGWWTPPLGPHAAIALESRQISGLGLRPFVSITDHDNLDAHASTSTNASVELTVQLPPTFVHLGIHNLPRARAHEVLTYAAHPAALTGWLARFPNVLVVLNHPLWDEAGIGESAHRAIVERFLARNHRDIHAIELNGLRPWSENRRVLDMASAWDIPVISGGDRHGVEPNANVNLSNADSFDAFVEEIRHRRQSNVLFLTQYRRPFPARIASNVLDILHDQPEHPLGWKSWSDRVFYQTHPGLVRSLSDFWAAGEPSLVKLFLRLASLLSASRRLAPVRFASALLQECRP